MRSLTLKSAGIFLGFWAIWNFAWIVSFFSLMNNSPEHYYDSIALVLIIWFVFALTGAIIIASIVNPLQEKYNRLQNLSGEELTSVAKKTINIHITTSFVYSLIWLIATAIAFLMFKQHYGKIGAHSILVGGIAGLIACPFMVFGVMPLVFSSVNRNISKELKKRNIKVVGSYLAIRNKFLLVFGASIIGLVIWIGGFAYYTGINQMIEEIKVNRLSFHENILKNFIDTDIKTYNIETLTKQVNKLKLPDNEIIFVTDKDGKFDAQRINKTFQKMQDINTSVQEVLIKNQNLSFYDNINQNIITISKFNADFYLITAVNIDKNISRMNEFVVWFVIFLLIALFVTATNSLSLSSWLGKTIKNLVHLFDKLAQNDFSENATKDSEDELGEITDKYNNFILEVRKLIESIQIAAQTLLIASQEISANNQLLTQRTSEQASSVEELSAVIEQLSSNIGQNTENAKQTEEIAEKSILGINQSNNSVEETITAMRSITEKAMLIIQIAKQTDILAINAAIEAARAGNAGKGFAVVASEVRKLAENTKEASNQIDLMTRNGIDVSDRSGSLLKITVGRMEKTGNLIRQVMESSIEQSSGIDQINTAVNLLNTISQENASNAEETASNSEELSAQAHELFAIVSKFKI